MTEEDYNLRKEVEQKTSIQPLAKVNPRESYLFTIAVKISKEGNKETEMIHTHQWRPIDYHKGIETLIQRVKTLKDNHEKVKLIELRELND